MNGWQPTPVTPAGEDAPAEVDLARFQAERDASQRRQERINRQKLIKKPRRDASAEVRRPCSGE
jgi:hypothetical protein